MHKIYIISILFNLFNTAYTHCAQQAGIFSQCTHTAHEPQHECNGAQNDEHKGGIQGNKREFTYISKHILLSPSPNAHGEDQQSRHPDENIAGKEQVFEAATDFTCFPSIFTHCGHFRPQQQQRD